MKRLLASRRRRRRIVVFTVVAALAAGATVIGLFYSNTGAESGSSSKSSGPSRPIIVPHQEKTVPMGPRLPEIKAVAAKFFATAVIRRNVDQSFDLVAPQLREGETRAQWKTGAIPVVPYPAGDLSFTKMSVTYSYLTRVGLIIGVFPKAHAKTPYEAFSMELTRYRHGPGYRWLVDSWAPAGIGIGNPNGPPVSNAPAVQSKASLGRIWILLPIIFLLSMIVMIPGGLFLRGWRRERSARRRLIGL
jgi:hypothetical protein